MRPRAPRAAAGRNLVLPASRRADVWKTVAGMELGFRLLLSAGRQSLLDGAGFQHRHFDEELENIRPKANRQIPCFLKLARYK